MFGQSVGFVVPPKSITSVDAAAFLLVDGSRPLTADWDAGAFQVRAETFYADVPTGTPPLVISSTTRVPNLNADTVDGLHAADLLQVATHRLRAPCRVATTSNVDLAGDETIDGVNLDDGDRVLVAFQTDPTENGIYVVDESSGGGWTRAADLAAAALAGGSLVVVREGDTYADSLWLCTDVAGDDVVDSDDLTFRPIASPGGIPEIANSDGATVTFNLNRGYSHAVTLGGNRTLALSNVRVGDRFLIKLTQDGTGSRTVTWFSGISWAGGVAPTLSTSAASSDVVGFVCTAAGAFDGYVVGQDL